jgi:uncharacterized SAM-dependent methyltransferase
MHLASCKAQTVHLPSPGGNIPIQFLPNETIHTENSYKYSLDEFARLAAMATFRVERAWVDPRRLFSVQYLTVG